jgi:hypothetical protein
MYGLLKYWKILSLDLMAIVITFEEFSREMLKLSIYGFLNIFNFLNIMKLAISSRCPTLSKT